MKINLKILAATLVLLSCSSESAAPSFEVEQNTGIWVPYEIIYSDGTIDMGPFYSRSIFGAYDESFQLNADKTYVPAGWKDSNNYQIDEAEKGQFEYLRDESKLVLTGGSWPMEFEITQFKSDDLWLTYLGDIPILGGAQTIYKLRRELKN